MARRFSVPLCALLAKLARREERCGRLQRRSRAFSSGCRPPRAGHSVPPASTPQPAGGDSPKALVSACHGAPQGIASERGGERPVIDIRVDILFMDGKDRILSRRAINPLVVSGGLFGDKTKPLFPGETRGFQADATQPPSGWINQLKAEVVYYQFAP